MKQLSILMMLLLAGCATNSRISTTEPLGPLATNEGYLSFVIDSLNSLSGIQWINTDTTLLYYAGSAPKGISTITMKVPAGEYCFAAFSVVNLKVDFDNKGFCTYVEAGELNYFTDFYVRNPITTSISDFPRYVKLLKNSHPELCKAYINEECKI